MTVYIEDVDTNGNNTPDLYEMDGNGGSLHSGTAGSYTTIAGGIAVNKALANLTATGTAASHRNGVTTAVAAKLSSAAYQSMVFQGESVEPEVVDGTLAVTALSLDQDAKTVTLVVDAETKTSLDGTAAAALYELPRNATVTLAVWQKRSLEEDWSAEPVATKEVTLGGDAASVVVDLGDDVDLSSGFYKVTIVE